MPTSAAHATSPTSYPAVLEPILRHLAGVTGGPVQFSAHCPAHDDRRASLSIGIGDTGVPVLRCHAGCPYDAIMRAIPGDDSATKEHVVGTYVYRDESGTPLYRVVRLEPKDFRAERPDGRGGWLRGIQGVRRVVYRLEDLPEVRRVFLVEGEPHADRLWSVGRPGTTTAFGAKGWRDEYAAQLQALDAAEVAALPDHDDAGRAYVRAAATALTRLGVAVRIVELPGLPPKGDVLDWLDGGHTVEELDGLVAATPVWTPDPVPSNGEPDPEAPANETDEAEIPAAGHASDLALAARFVVDHSEEVRYVAGEKEGHWHVWSGERWERDVRGRVYELAKATARSLLLEATEPTKGLDYQKVVSLAKKASSAGGIANMVKLARTDPRLVILTEQLDANPFLFNTRSGTLDLSDANAIVLRPWRAVDLISRIAPVQYDPRAQCPMFERFVGRIFAERDELIAYVQRFLGSTLVGEVYEETFHIGTGTGANGKSTLVEILRGIYGEDQYMGSLPLNALAMKKQDAIPSDIAAIVGTRLVTAVEAEGGRQLAEALIKMLSGRDYTKTRAMYEDWFGFTPTFRLLMMTNHLPKIQHQDEGIWRRIHVIPFDVSIPRAEQDGGLRDRIVAHEGPGVLNWLIAGYQAYRNRGYDPPAEVTAATADYRAAEDAVGRFVEDVVMIEVMGSRTVGTVTFKKMYDAFTRWCADFGHQLVPGPDFHARLKRRFEQGRGKQGMHYKGVQLAADYGSEGLGAA